MKIHHAALHPDLAMSVKDGHKTLTMRPLKPQPILENGLLKFGANGDLLAVNPEDYPCPFGSPGDLLVFYFEGNSSPFYFGKITDVSIQRLLETDEQQAKLEGMDSRASFLLFWDAIYGETEFASHFNPLVWAIRYCKG